MIEWVLVNSLSFIHRQHLVQLEESVLSCFRVGRFMAVINNCNLESVRRSKVSIQIFHDSKPSFSREF